MLISECSFVAEQCHPYFEAMLRGELLANLPLAHLAPCFFRGMLAEVGIPATHHDLAHPAEAFDGDFLTSMAITHLAPGRRRMLFADIGCATFAPMLNRLCPAPERIVKKGSLVIAAVFRI